ncbi:MAG: hypothetical protein IRY83_05915 [Chloroflexi bacterium]|nr:hypothetical protein [Chloroflexota bacterium]
MIYRQRETIFDEFLLQVVFPWLTALHATPLRRLARFWMVPVRTGTAHRPASTPAARVWSKITG